MILIKFNNFHSNEITKIQKEQMISLPSEALFLGITYRGLRYRLPTATSTRLSAERLASFRSRCGMP